MANIFFKLLFLCTISSLGYSAGDQPELNAYRSLYLEIEKKLEFEKEDYNPEKQLFISLQQMHKSLYIEEENTETGIQNSIEYISKIQGKSKIELIKLKESYLQVRENKEKEGENFRSLISQINEEFKKIKNSKEELLSFYHQLEEKYDHDDHFSRASGLNLYSIRSQIFEMFQGFVWDQIENIPSLYEDLKVTITQFELDHHNNLEITIQETTELVQDLTEIARDLSRDLRSIYDEVSEDIHDWGYKVPSDLRCKEAVIEEDYLPLVESFQNYCETLQETVQRIKAIARNYQQSRNMFDQYDLSEINAKHDLLNKLENFLTIASNDSIPSADKLKKITDLQDNIDSTHLVQKLMELRKYLRISCSQKNSQYFSLSNRIIKKYQKSFKRELNIFASL